MAVVLLVPVSMSGCATVTVVEDERCYFVAAKLQFQPRNSSVTFVCVGADNGIRSCDGSTAGIYEVNEGRCRRKRRGAPPCALAWLCEFTATS